MGQNDIEAAGVFSPMVESAFLVITCTPESRDYKPEHLLAELSGLVDTMGFRVLGHEIVNLKQKNSRYLIGSGKTEVIIEKAKELEVDCIIFDDDLSPSQQRNWEELSGICVIDRREVILDIFSLRAKTKEAVLQVGLARMEYSLPRLTRAWTHLSRQKGGARGNRGEGETQLEMDRRIVLKKISKMKKELEKVRSSRSTMRHQRISVPEPSGSLIGYTNAGKSSLLNALSGSNVFVEDKLFATLDTTTRKIALPGGKEILLTDTVGFIRKLPHDLVETFKSTLEETRYADFLLHILDASSPEVQHHYDTTMSVLHELGVDNKPMIIVFNKADKLEDKQDLPRLHNRHEHVVRISALNKTGFEELAKAMEQVLYEEIKVYTYLFPASRHDLVALLHRKGKIVEEHYEEDGIKISAMVPDHIRNRLESFLHP